MCAGRAQRARTAPPPDGGRANTAQERGGDELLGIRVGRGERVRSGHSDASGCRRDAAAGSHNIYMQSPYMQVQKKWTSSRPLPAKLAYISYIKDLLKEQTLLE